MPSWAAHLFGSFLGVDGHLLSHGSQDDDIGVLLVSAEELLDLVTNFALGDFDVVLGGAILRHEGQETVVGDIKQLVFATVDVGNLHVVGGWGQIFHLLAGEDVNGNQVDFGVTVLPSLGGRHFDDLAWAALDDDEAVLSQGGTLHRKGGRGAGIGRLEGVFMLRVVRHGGG